MLNSTGSVSSMVASMMTLPAALMVLIELPTEKRIELLMVDAFLIISSVSFDSLITCFVMVNPFQLVTRMYRSKRTAILRHCHRFQALGFSYSHITVYTGC